MKMILNVVSSLMTVTLFAGCASMEGTLGPRGPQLFGSEYSNEYESYAEVGVKFSSIGDFVAVVSPNRWKSPLKTGGSLSWVNPGAWSDDPGRTGRILAGEATVAVSVMVGVAIGSSSGGSGSDSAPSSGGPAGNPDINKPADPPPRPSR